MESFNQIQRMVLQLMIEDCGHKKVKFSGRIWSSPQDFEVLYDASTNLVHTIL